MRINHASRDERFRTHPGLALYGIESYLAVPLRRRDGSYFGTLCTLDPAPTDLAEDAAAIFTLLADLIAFELEADEQGRQQEAQIRALEDVIAIAGHDLRQPLTILLGRLQLLARAARRATLTPEELAARVEELTGQVRRAPVSARTGRPRGRGRPHAATGTSSVAGREAGTDAGCSVPRCSVPRSRSTKRRSSPATGSDSFQMVRVDCQNCRGNGPVV